ncbi:MAG: hypothetical protein EA397_09620 [Deltaproteobacteria bacterium]|nr:MAG: hypothetical protein EA397_09620 [Deltaproteobacteria bacterium]
MADIIAPPGLFRRRSTWLALVLIALIGGVGMGVGLGWRAAVQRTLLSARCEPIERVELSIDDIVALKRRWKRFLRASAQELAHFDVSPAELAFLLSGESSADIALQATGDRLVARAAVPMASGCYNIYFQGGFRIDEGVAILEVERLVIGDTDISDLGALGGALGGSRQVVAPEDLQDEDLAGRLRNIQRLRIEEGRVRVRFVDTEAVWR